MNVFAINAEPVNDSNEIWSWYGYAGLIFQADGAVACGLTASASADVVSQADLVPRLHLITPGDATVALLVDGQALYGRSATGMAQIEVTTSGSGIRWTFGTSDLTAAFELDGDAQVVEQVSVSFNITIDAVLDGRAATVHQGEAVFPIALDTRLDYRVARPQFLEGDAPVVLGMEALPYLLIYSVSGASSLGWLADGSARFGGMLYGEGAAALEWVATGEALQRHYHYAEASVTLQVTVKAERYGLPIIPTQFIAAPSVRALFVGAEPRAFTVPAERRA